MGRPAAHSEPRVMSSTSSAMTSPIASCPPIGGCIDSRDLLGRTVTPVSATAVSAIWTTSSVVPLGRASTWVVNCICSIATVPSGEMSTPGTGEPLAMSGRVAGGDSGVPPDSSRGGLDGSAACAAPAAKLERSTTTGNAAISVAASAMELARAAESSRSPSGTVNTRVPWPPLATGSSLRSWSRTR